MSKLPEWIEKASAIDNLHLKQAFAIAWEALDSTTRPEGRYSTDHYEHAMNTIDNSIEKAKDAMRQIEELGPCVCGHPYVDHGQILGKFGCYWVRCKSHGCKELGR